MPGDSARDVEIFVGSPDEGKQAQWKARSLLANFVDKTSKTLQGSFLSSMSGFQECHRCLWPGAEVPTPTADHVYGRSQTSKKKEALTVPTTLAFSALMYMIRHQGRERRLRQKAFELLKAIIDRACAVGLTLDVLVADIDGQGHWTSQTCNNPKGFEVWTEAYRLQHVNFQWGVDAMSDDKPWIASTSSQPHLVDFIAFCIDQPAALKKRANAEFLNARKQLEKSALSIVSQIAVDMDRRMARYTEPLKSVRLMFKRQRLDSASKWQFIAAALHRLINGEERWG